MFHPHFLRLSFGIPHSTADAMTLVSVFKMEEDLQDKWREDRERESKSDVGRCPESLEGKKTSFRL